MSAVTVERPSLWNVSQAAARLGVHSATAYRLLARGELPGAVKIGPSWRVDPERLEAWIEEHAQ